MIWLTLKYSVSKRKSSKKVMRPELHPNLRKKPFTGFSAKLVLTRLMYYYDFNY